MTTSFSQSMPNMSRAVGLASLIAFMDAWGLTLFTEWWFQFTLHFRTNRAALEQFHTMNQRVSFYQCCLNMESLLICCRQSLEGQSNSINLSGLHKGELWRWKNSKPILDEVELHYYRCESMFLCTSFSSMDVRLSLSNCSYGICTSARSYR